ncbi:hypothetical protein VaNZ11_009242 [Volvox africanus]|uniref:Guanylate cyclase domain-containing protein n=1 Tax=Volvox africanus TaxID=51714 RepID=A0ABQ5S6U6_9CHLO|nr:hypothetical protein VaNZ11_009242 [Volvox africanus]
MSNIVLYGLTKLGRSSTLLALLLLLRNGAISQTSQTCDKEIQRMALLSLYEASDGPSWLNNALWNTNQSCVHSLQLRQGANKQSQEPNANLPSFCCWAGVDCCLLEGNNTDYKPCSQYQCNCDVGTVIGLSLGRNGVKGRLEDILNPTVLDSLACSLRMVFLGGNNISGTLPATLTKLTDLRILALSSNAISGQLPDELSNLLKLEELDLSNNALTGSVPSQLCGGTERLSKLRDLTLSNNKLTGNLVLPDCETLIYLDVQNNMLSGPILDVSSYRQLHILRLGNNNFSGTVSIDSFALRLLVVLDLSMNNFSGPLPNFVGNSSQLTIVRLFNNSFSGTISPNVFSVGTLANFLAYNNELTGTLPENIGDARGISSLTLRGNNLYGTLPASLAQLAPNMGTVDLSLTQMSCCGSDFVQGEGYRYFNLSAPKLPSFLKASDLSRPVVDTDVSLANMRCPFIVVDSDTTGGEFVTWALDPEYYLYEGCGCLEGFYEVWQQHEDGEPSMGPTLTCVKSLAPWYELYPWAVVLIVLGGLLVLSWLTFQMCFRRGKNAAIVQGIFNIRKRIQGEPVGRQVSIVVTDIEGYSDLMKQSPELMTRALNLHNAIIRKARWGNFGYTLEQEGDSYALVFYEAHDAVIFCLQTQLALNRQTWPEGLFTADVKEPAAKRRPQAPSLLNAISVMTHSLFGGRGGGLGQTSDERNNSVMGVPSSMSAQHAPLDGRADSRQSSLHGLGPEASTLMTPSAMMGTSSQKGQSLLFNGLRVRMGVATGALPPGSSSKGSAVMDLAKMVSDMANGGQIMIDEATFKNIKERMEELGAVDHNGMNFKKLNSIQLPWYSCVRRKGVRNPDDALLLDMGEYTHCPGCKQLPLLHLEGTPVGSDTSGTTGVSQPLATPKGRLGKTYEPVRVYQVAPPALTARAKVFCNKVALKDEWFCSDSPYFAAPGTLEAPLGAVEGPLELPAITMAFAIAEGGKTYATRYRRDVRRVNDVAAACIRACLRVVSGGYLCRLQDGDLKYMVAFATPQAALEWALLLQEVLMYANWPESALKHWRDEYDDRGRLVFRGPRMKIGLCEGCPRSIIPDHIGRADYHGASINQAARYMDAAAHGGMVALEASLAVRIMAKWREEAEAANAANAAVAAAAVAAAAMAVSGASGAAKARVKGIGTSAFATVEGSPVAAAAVAITMGNTSVLSGGAGRGASGSSSTTTRSSGLSFGGAHNGGGGTVAATAAAPMVPPSPPHSGGGGGSHKCRMAAVQEVGQETEAADGSEALLPPPQRQGAVPSALAAVLPEAAAVSWSGLSASRARSSGPGGLGAAAATSAAAATATATAAAATSAATVATAPGPVAEAAEGDARDPASDPAAAASTVAAASTAAVATIDGEAAEFAAAISHDTLSCHKAVESGPSMTSLNRVSYMMAALGTSSSTMAAAAPLLPYRSSETEPLPSAGGSVPNQPPPPPSLAHVTSAASCDGWSSFARDMAVSVQPPPPPPPPPQSTPSEIATGSPMAAAAAVAIHSDTPGDHQPAAGPDATGNDSGLPPPSCTDVADTAAPVPSALRCHDKPHRPQICVVEGQSALPFSHPIAKQSSSILSPGEPFPKRVSSAASNTGGGGGGNSAVAALTVRRPPSAPGTAPESLGTSASSSIGPLLIANVPSSCTRSPWLPPLSLPPLALPSERERDEALQADRAEAAEAKKVQVDGSPDAIYRAHVLAYRIGVFRFKGNPEPLQMAHVVLEHLAGRRFPNDAPKGKGAKVSDSSGLLDECDTTLPDLASSLRDRYMLMNSPAHGGGRNGSSGGLFGTAQSVLFDAHSSSPTNRRLRALLTSYSVGANTNSHLGAATASAAAAAVTGAGGFRKSRSLAARVGLHGVGGGGGRPLATDSGGHRRPAVILHLAHFATAPLRWASGRGAGAGGGLVPGHRDAHGGGGAAAAAVTSQQDLELSPATVASTQCHGTYRRAPAEGAVGVAVASDTRGGSDATGSIPGLAVSAVTTAGSISSVRSEVPSQVQGASSEAGIKQDINDGSAGGARGASRIGNSEPRVGRPSPLRFMSGRDGPLPTQHSVVTADSAAAVPAAVATTAVRAPQVTEWPAGHSIGMSPGDERV